MRINRKIMRNYRGDPEKVREIFETARHTDRDRGRVAEDLAYLPNRYNRFNNNVLIAMGGVLVGGLIAMVNEPNQFYGESPSLAYHISQTLALASGAKLAYEVIKEMALPSLKISSRLNNYENARQDAIRNIETEERKAKKNAGLEAE